MLKLIAINSHTRPVNVVKLNSDGDLLFSASNDKKVCLYYSCSGERIGTFDCASAVKSIDVTHNSQLLFTLSMVGQLEIWEVDGGKRLATLAQRERKARYVQLLAGDEEVMILTTPFSVDRKKGEKMTTDIRFYNVREIIEVCGKADDHTVFSNEKFLRQQIQLDGIYNVARIGPANKYIYLGSDFGKGKKNFVKVIDRASGKVVMQKIVAQHPIHALNFDKNFCFLSTASKDGCKVLDPRTLEIKKYLKTDFPMKSCAFTPNMLHDEPKMRKFHLLIGGGIDAREAAIVSSGGYEVHIMDLKYEEEIGKIEGHFGQINCLEYHRDGKGFVSAGEEGIVRIYRFQQTDPDQVFAKRKQAQEDQKQKQ